MATVWHMCGKCVANVWQVCGKRGYAGNTRKTTVWEPRREHRQAHVPLSCACVVSRTLAPATECFTTHGNPCFVFTKTPAGRVSDGPAVGRAASRATLQRCSRMNRTSRGNERNARAINRNTPLHLNLAIALCTVLRRLTDIIKQHFDVPLLIHYSM